MSLALPIPKGYRPVPCPLCAGSGLAYLSHINPRRCPTCRGGGSYAETWLTEGDGIQQRARSLGLAS